MFFKTSIIAAVAALIGAAVAIPSAPFGRQVLHDPARSSNASTNTMQRKRRLCR